MDETVERGYCSSYNEHKKVISILTLAEEAGMSTGFVTTARATHATPAALYAHSSDRGWESDQDMRKKAKDDPSNCTDIGTVNYDVISQLNHFSCISGSLAVRLLIYDNDNDNDNEDGEDDDDDDNDDYSYQSTCPLIEFFS